MHYKERPFLVGFVVGLLAYLVVSLIGRDAGAKDWVLGLDELSLDYRNHAVMNPNQRDPLLFPESPKEAINVNIKTDIFQVIGWDSQIQSQTTDSQYRSIGLQTSLMLRVTQHLDVGVWHQSNHLLDRAPATLPRFPSQDALQIKLYLFRANPARESVF